MSAPATTESIARPASSEPAPDEMPVRAHAGLVRAAFVAFVLFQLLVPLSYYVRDDPFDERFAWRMFSDIRMHQCVPRAFESRGGEPTAIVLGREIHYAWIEHLGRNRRVVIERFLESRCTEPGISSATVVNVCRDTEGADLPARSFTRDCASGRTSERRAPAPSPAPGQP